LIDIQQDLFKIMHADQLRDFAKDNNVFGFCLGDFHDKTQHEQREYQAAGRSGSCRTCEA
jgi:hypothetical protein